MNCYFETEPGKSTCSKEAHYVMVWSNRPTNPDLLCMEHVEYVIEMSDGDPDSIYTIWKFR